MPYVDLGDYSYHYTEYGDKKNPTIMFLHAFTLDGRMWEQDAIYFSEKYHVVVPDLKGHGKSDAPLSGYTRDDRVADLVTFITHMNLDSIHLVGLSYGGTTAIGLALERPELFSTLTLIGTSAAGYKLGTKISAIDNIARQKGVEAAKKRWTASSLLWYTNEQQEIRDFVKLMMEEHSGAVWNDPERGSYPNLNDLEKIPSINIPTQIIVGEADKMFLPLAYKLDNLFPVSELSIIADCGHLVNLEQPEVFRKKLESFLNKHLQ